MIHMVDSRERSRYAHKKTTAIIILAGVVVLVLTMGSLRRK